MDEHDLAHIVGAQIADATSYIDSNIGPDRALATNYYKGEPFGNEEEGRSQVVSRDVQDTVLGILPSLMRVFFGPEKVVEFVAQNKEDVPVADQATDYVNYIFTRDNPGFEILYAAFKDALIRKVGVVKYWWDDTEEVSTQEYSGLDQAALAKVLEDLKTVEKVEEVDREDTPDGLKITLKLTRKKNRVCCAAVPPEEFLIDRRARDIDTASFVAHRSMKTVSELVAMGYDEDMVKARAGPMDNLAFNREIQARNPYNTGVGNQGDQATNLVQYVEGYILADVDGDGIAELVRVCTIGTDHQLVHHEPAEHRNFAAFHCDPEPHTFFGYSVADKVMDLQRIKSALIRNTLDSLSLAINPRMVVVANDGNVADAQNNEIGAILRAKTGAGYVPLVVPDVSKSGYEALSYMDQVKENRTGMSRVSLGLDPKALQNTTATASAAQFGQAQQHIELIARIFAETGMKRLFRGILRLTVENQRQARTVALRNTWVQVDPRSWRTDMDVSCNVALGGGTNAEKANILSLVMQKQELVMQTLGLGNSLVGLPEYHNSLSQYLSLAGFKNPDAFFKDPAQADPNQPPAQPPPDPEMMKVQAQIQGEQAKAQASAQIEQQKSQAKMAMDQQAAQHALQLQAQKNDLDMKLMQAKHEQEFALKQRQADMEAELKRQEQAFEFQLKQQEMAWKLQNAPKVDGAQFGGEPG